MRLLWLLLLAICTGCAGPRIVVSGGDAPLPRRPRSIAVLSVQTVAGPDEVGRLVTASLRERLGRVFAVPAEQPRSGASGQDRFAALREGRRLSVDAVLYGIAFVLIYDREHTYYPEREPELGVALRLLDVASGQSVWERTVVVTKPPAFFALRTTAAEEVLRLVAPLADKAVEPLLTSEVPDAAGAAKASK